MSTLTRRRVFPTGAWIEIGADHSVHIMHGGREYDQEPWMHEEIQGALAYLPNGELVVIVSRLPGFIREELGRIRWVGARLFSSLFNKAQPQSGGVPPYLRR